MLPIPGRRCSVRAANPIAMKCRALSSRSSAVALALPGVAGAGVQRLVRRRREAGAGRPRAGRRSRPPCSSSSRARRAAERSTWHPLGGPARDTAALASRSRGGSSPSTSGRGSRPAATPRRSRAASASSSARFGASPASWPCGCSSKAASRSGSSPGYDLRRPVAAAVEPRRRERRRRSRELQQRLVDLGFMAPSGADGHGRHADLDRRRSASRSGPTCRGTGRSARRRSRRSMRATRPEPRAAARRAGGSRCSFAASSRC